MTVDRLALRDAAYARLKACEALGGSLVRERRPAAMRAALEAILANGRRTLAEVGETGDPYLLSHTHMTCAAARADLARLEVAGRGRYEHLRACGEHCDEALGIVLDGDSAAVALKVIPWAMVVLTSALNRARGHQLRAFQVRLETCVRELEEASERQQRDAAAAAKTLFASQALLEGAGALAPAARAVVLRRAGALASEASGALRRAGAVEIAAQAKATIAAIAAASAPPATPAPPPPAAGPTPAKYPKFCPSCGTPTTGKRFCASCGQRLAG